MKPIPWQPMIEPVIYTSENAVPTSGRWTTLAKLFRQAGITLRATVPSRKILVYYGRRQIRTNRVDAVGVPTRNLDGRMAAIRALEALAYSFHDHAVRHSVCGRGLFVAPA